jgi:hypothetical protein
MHVSCNIDVVASIVCSNVISEDELTVTRQIRQLISKRCVDIYGNNRNSILFFKGYDIDRGTDTHVAADITCIFGTQTSQIQRLTKIH